ncbi:hypothetical protein HWB74_gp34 [Paenibacillus phage Jacopo]|uniref:Uncharacterized protein n=8 Tax=root TaxID=1 RepID=A0A345ARV4_9CAUD|nr:hypothetical protein HWB70_gp34 [Paenibacillus phage Yyerffej]YP_009838937.1 hypothetical protein HWB74_gp34 [Paenibacillus phage Jacopo]AXF40047.1 hypothetical protein BLOOM_34 [Paenibacillus phage Bloom]AXF40406.1 hypothetical protein LYCANUS1_34 [Paenibacillus phage Genki]AXF42273.1 hypothetical protein LYCANUS2_34 [Paenibacillus phage Gryphonian]AXH45294.1 hypothetical protein ARCTICFREEZE_34 [Paenibacillus phage Arcticfreeze]AXH45360.1 hypothetical protein DEVRI_34 [Paenibacillus phag
MFQIQVKEVVHHCPHFAHSGAYFGLFLHVFRRAITGNWKPQKTLVGKGLTGFKGHRRAW